jgi:hypothetical protein
MAVNKVKAKAQPATESEASVLASAEPAPQTSKVELAVPGSNDPTAREGEAGQVPQVQAIFGVVLELGNPPKQVIFSSDTIADIKEKGLELELPEPVKLGTFKQLIESAQEQFGVTFPTTDELPPPLKTAVDKLEALEVTIVTAHIKVPSQSQSDAGDTTKYTLVMTALAKDDLFKLGDQLKVKGVVVGVTNDPKKKGNTSTT